MMCGPPSTAAPAVSAALRHLAVQQQKCPGVPGFGSSLDCNRFYKDYPALIRAAGKNGFAAQSAPASETRAQRLTVGPVSSEDAWTLLGACRDLGLTEAGLYRSAWADETHTTQTLTIGPVSRGMPGR